MKQIIEQIPHFWDSAKFEQDFNCVVYAQDNKLIIVSQNEIKDIDAKIAANVSEYAAIKEAKTNLLNRLGITAEEAKLLLS